MAFDIPSVAAVSSSGCWGSVARASIEHDVV